MRMHHYLRTIGFSNLKNRSQLDQLLKEVVSKPDTEKLAIDSDGNEFIEIVHMYSECFGITVCGEYQDDNNFYINYFYPVFIGRDISTEEQIEIERHTANESYAGVCDEMCLGVTLTIGKNEEQLRNTEQNRRNHNHLMAAARDGDEEAIESLTLEDIDLYSMISRRVEKEDVLSIVESYFMPYGIESDQYSIMGQILDSKKVQNHATKEEMYIMKINANDLVFDLCINEKDLIGEPEVGRRFKGNIWMQGKINFSD